MNIVTLIVQSGWVAKGVLVLLLVFSVLSWSIIFQKYIILRRAETESHGFLTFFRESKNLTETFKIASQYKSSPLASLFQEGYRELNFILKTNPTLGGEASAQAVLSGAKLPMREENLDSLSRTMRQATLEELYHLERYLIFLATTGNVTPFIGLFGTVWGIIDAFHALGMQGSASIAAVAPGISEALVTTAAGLLAAVPAVIFYNYYLSKIKAMGTKMDMFSLEFLQVVERIVVKK